MLLVEKASHLRESWSDKNTVAFDSVTTGSPKKYLWTCPLGHEWESRPVNRILGKGCPGCSGRATTKRNSLKTKAPHLESEWSSKNTVKFEDVSYSSGIPRLWICKKGHEWEASPNSRRLYSKTPSHCQSCRIDDTSLKAKVPHLEAEWSSKNIVKFEEVSYGSGIKRWWVCEKGHEWEAIPNSRSKGNGCKVCAGKVVSETNSLQEKAPHLEREWSAKNAIKFSEVSFGSTQECWWVCEKGHEWTAEARYRKKHGCPYCSGRRVSELNSLKTKAPHLEQEWSQENATSFEDVSFGSAQRSRWVCGLGHKWEASPNSRISNDNGCPYCSGRRVSELNSLKTKAPHLEKEWSPKNTVPFEEASYGSGKEYLWVCENGHEEKKSAWAKVENRGCQECRKLPTKAPWLLQQWNNKNTILFSEVHFASTKKRWWVCEKGHEWKAVVYSRTSRSEPTGCPSCSISFNKLEKRGSELFGVPKFNAGCGPRNPDGNLYHPDFKLSDTTYLNTDGLYWHSEEQKGRTYHFDARVAFEKAGLRLLQFWEDEIQNKPEIVKSMVDAVLNKTQTKLHARKLEAIELKQTQVNEFLAKNHIIGPVHFSSALGLQNKDKTLVQVLTYNKTKDGLQITRTATLLNTLVRGGLSKLVAAVKAKENPGKIITFCDLRYADGHSLEKLGFVKTGTSIQYQYTNGYERKDKRLFRVPKGVSEIEEAAKKGWYRIYDAGRSRYELKC